MCLLNVHFVSFLSVSINRIGAWRFLFENKFKTWSPHLNKGIMRVFRMRLKSCEALFFFHSSLFLPSRISALKSMSGTSPRSASGVGVTHYARNWQTRRISPMRRIFPRRFHLLWWVSITTSRVSLQPHIRYPVRQWWIAFWSKQSLVRLLRLLWSRNGEHLQINADVRHSGQENLARQTIYAVPIGKVGVIYTKMQRNAVQSV